MTGHRKAITVATLVMIAVGMAAAVGLSGVAAPSTSLTDHAQRYFMRNAMLASSLQSFANHEPEMTERARRFSELASEKFGEVEPPELREVAEITLPPGYMRYLDLHRELVDAAPKSLKEAGSEPEEKSEEFLKFAARLPETAFGETNLAAFQTAQEVIAISPSDIDRADISQLAHAANELASRIADKSWQSDDRRMARQLEMAVSQIALSMLTEDELKEMQAFVDNEQGAETINKLTAAYENAVRETMEAVIKEYFEIQDE